MIFRKRTRGSARDASLLAGPLVTLSEPFEDQLEYLAGRAQEPDLSDLDPSQELLEEFDEALEMTRAATSNSNAATEALAAVEDALRVPNLGDDMEALRTDPLWARVREVASAALRTLRSEGLVTDAIPFRLLPRRFAPQLKPLFGSPNEWPTIILTQAEFDRFDQAWERALPESIPADEVQQSQIHVAATAVYARYPEILEALSPLLRA